jgi:hypothetical protein
MLLSTRHVALHKLSEETTSENMTPSRRLGSNCGKRLLLIATLALAVSRAVTCLSAQTSPAATTVNLPPMSLTLVAANGTQLVLTSSDIGSLPSFTGYGGYETQGGFIRGLGNYTGIPLVTLCNLVGGIANGDNLKITASDNYTQTFSYDQLSGNFTTFDAVTGQPVSHNQSLTPILAYYSNGANLSSSEGPLRLAIVGPEGLVTTSAYWVKFVVKMEILSGPAEFPWLLLIVPVVLLVVVVVAVICKSKAGKGWRRKRSKSEAIGSHNLERA